MLLACSTDTADTGSRSSSDKQTEKPNPMDLPAVIASDTRPTAMVRLNGPSQCFVHETLPLDAYAGAREDQYVGAAVSDYHASIAYQKSD